MLLTKEVEIKVSPRTFKYYKELGYDFEHIGDVITVRIEDLTKGSKAIIYNECDICHKTVTPVKYEVWNRVMEKTGSYCCKECSNIKKENTCIKKYGTKNVSSVTEFRNKMVSTNIEKYGCGNYAKTQECREKTVKTNLQKYGCEAPLQNKEIYEKVKQTNLLKYGVENIIDLQEVKDKIINTNIERYGYPNVAQNPDIYNKTRTTTIKRYGGIGRGSDIISEKTCNTLYKNQSQKTSRQQRYISELYNGILNYPVSYYNLDIAFPEEKIDIEYNGGGHNLCVKTGELSQEEFNQKEIIRGNTIKRAGFKQITIISTKDFLPSDEILLKMLEQAKQYFNSTNHTWVEYNIDTSLMRNAENKEGVFFDFGNLRKIKKAS